MTRHPVINPHQVITNRRVEFVSRRLYPGATFREPVPAGLRGIVVGEVIDGELFKVDFGPLRGTRLIDVDALTLIPLFALAA